MLGNEVRSRYAIAVAENDIVGTRCGECAVADRRRAKSLVFMPDMSDGKFRASFEFIHYPARVAGRAVVGHQQFEFGIVLRQIAGQHRSQRVGTIVSGDYDRYSHARR